MHGKNLKCYRQILIVLSIILQIRTVFLPNLWAICCLAVVKTTNFIFFYLTAEVGTQLDVFCSISFGLAVCELWTQEFAYFISSAETYYSQSFMEVAPQSSLVAYQSISYMSIVACTVQFGIQCCYPVTSQLHKQNWTTPTRILH